MTFHATCTVTGTAEELSPLMASENLVLSELKAKGVVTRALLSADRERAFLVIESTDEHAARAELDRLPLVGAGQMRFTLDRVVEI
jgi:hypothetical protein